MMAATSDVVLLEDYVIKEAPSTVHYIPDYITKETEEYLLKQVYSVSSFKWTQLSNRRLQNWGGLPHHKGMLKEDIPRWLGKVTSDVGATCRRSFNDHVPNHVLINEYTPGQGIMPHEDGPLYYPVVTTVSLGSHTLLDFYSKVSEEQCSLESRYQFSLLLEPRSLLLLEDDMYTGYLHGIAERKHDEINNNIINLPYCRLMSTDTLVRDTRVSLTIRYVPKVLKLKIGK